MKTPGKFIRRAFPLIVAFALVCGATGVAQSIAQEPGTQYVRTDLLSDFPGRAIIYYSLFASAWGMAADSTGGPWWVADNGSGYATLNTGEGRPFPGLSPLYVGIPTPPGAIGPAGPRGVVYNGSSDFALAPDRPARFIFATGEGTIAGWNPEVDRHYAVLAVDNSPYAAYTGAAMARSRGGNRLYAANFGRERIDVFDTDFKPVALAPGAFIDPDIPGGFAPFNVQNIDGELYVAFARQDADSRNAVKGSGLGYVAVFDAEGNPIMRLEHGPWMNTPWGIALAPDDFGVYGGKLLVGNSGSGGIAVFDPETGIFLDFLKGPDGSPLTIDGLRGLGFGNNGLAGQANTLYFTAGTDGSRHGLFGAVTAGAPVEQVIGGPTGIY